jgi:shikimate kinase
MGSGKSTISKMIASKMGIDALDLDDYIVEKENNSIQSIFKNKGEVYFRLKENEYLKELLNSDKSFVLALGGGTPCYANNMDLIVKSAKSVYLKGNVNTLFDRLHKEKASRPLISTLNDDKLVEFIAKHLFERAPFYERANHIVGIDSKTINKIVDEISKLI